MTLRVDTSGAPGGPGGTRVRDGEHGDGVEGPGAVAGSIPEARVEARVNDGLARPHVLLIEDSEDNREMLRMLLELDGFRVDVAADGEQGVKQAVALRPHVALVDLGLPALDGYEVARQVRAALGPSIRLVALTGYGQPEDRARTAAAGFDAHVTKPVDHDALKAVLTASA
jgi:CheY-like chemotaxis protein